MIFLRNTQRKIPLNYDRIVRDLQIILDTIEYPTYGLGVWITNNQTIRKFNHKYRSIDKPTDVLSFPAYPELKAGERIKPECCDDDACDDQEVLGDLILSAEYIVKEAIKHNVTFEERFRLLLVHGICHLLGYDHIKDTDFRRMRQKEESILKRLKEAPEDSEGTVKEGEQRRTVAMRCS